MRRCITTLATSGLLISLATHLPAAEPNAKPGDDVAVQLKAAQDEQIKLLTKLVKVLTMQYRIGAADFAQLCAAQRDLSNALLDSTDDPEKRNELLTKELQSADDLVKLVEARRNAGMVSEADVLRAKSEYVEVKVRLLRERSRKKPASP
jgi:hypothetical protein